jgi:hypothetical protein
MAAPVTTAPLWSLSVPDRLPLAAAHNEIGKQTTTTIPQMLRKETAISFLGLLLSPMSCYQDAQARSFRFVLENFSGLLQ